MQLDCCLDVLVMRKIVPSVNAPIQRPSIHFLDGFVQLKLFLFLRLQRLDLSGSSRSDDFTFFIAFAGSNSFHVENHAIIRGVCMWRCFLCHDDAGSFATIFSLLLEVLRLGYIGDEDVLPSDLLIERRIDVPNIKNHVWKLFIEDARLDSPRKLRCCVVPSHFRLEMKRERREPERGKCREYQREK